MLGGHLVSSCLVRPSDIVDHHPSSRKYFSERQSSDKQLLWNTVAFHAKTARAGKRYLEECQEYVDVSFIAQVKTIVIRVGSNPTPLHLC